MLLFHLFHTETTDIFSVRNINLVHCADSVYQGLFSPIPIVKEKESPKNDRKDRVMLPCYLCFVGLGSWYMKEKNIQEHVRRLILVS